MTKEEYTIFYKVNYHVIKSFIRKYIKDAYRAEDITQDAFSILWIERENVNYKKAFLYKTAKNIMLNFINKEKKIEYLEDLNELNYYHTKQYSDLEEILNNALNKLPESQRSVLLLKDYDGYLYKEIVVITSLNMAQVKFYIHCARASVKKYIGSIESVI